jgi:hypothetical protein
MYVIIIEQRNMENKAQLAFLCLHSYYNLDKMQIFFHCGGQLLKSKDVENIFHLGMVAYAYDPITWGSDAEGSQV